MSSPIGSVATSARTIQLYYATRDTVNIRVGFRFNNKRVQVSIIETASEKYIAVYAHD